MPVSRRFPIHVAIGPICLGKMPTFLYGHSNRLWGGIKRYPLTFPLEGGPGENMAPARTTLYSKNLQVLSRHHAHILEVLNTPAPFSMAVRTSLSGSPNLYIKESQDGEERSLYREKDPLAGLPQALAKMEDVRGRIVCNYGFGLGLHAIEIVRVLARANIVVLFEAHPAVFEAALHHVDLVALLSHPNVRLVVGQVVDFFAFLAGDPEELFASVSSIAIRFDGAVALAPSWYQQVSSAMTRYNQYQIETHVTLANAGLLFIRNRFRNLMAMSRAVPMERTTEMLSGIPAVVVAAGPSLSKNIDQLKKIEGRALLIVVDSAVGPLAEKGISPDLVVSHDYRPLTYEKLGRFREFLRNTGLIFTGCTSFEVSNYIPFRARFFTFCGPMYRDVLNRILQTDVAEPMGNSQSVLHLALHFVRQAGCNPIIFTGLDLAFDGGRDHAEGTVLHWGNRQETGKNTSMVPGIHGRMVPTIPGFINMLVTCEQRIQEAPDRTWIDATEGGAKIAGTDIMTLEEATHRFCRKPVDVSGIFNLSATGISTGQMGKTLESLQGEIRGCLTRIDTYFTNASRIDDYLSKNRMPEKGAAGLPKHIRGLLERIEGLLSDSEDAALRRLLVDFVTGPRQEIIREHRAKVLAANVSNSQAEEFISAYEQLKASQTIWRDGFQYILELINHELEAFEIIESLKVEKITGENVASTALAGAYFKCGYLGLAEQCLEKMSSETVAGEFYRGAIRLKQGEVATGLGLMNSAVQKKESFGEELQRIIQAVEDEWLSAEGPETFQAIMRKRLVQMGPSKKVLKALWPKDVDVMDRILSEDPPHPERLETVDSILSDWNPAKEKLPEWWAVKARSLSVRGLPEDGLAAVQTALQMTKDENPQWLVLLARLLIETGRADEGISKLDKAVAMDPSTAGLWEEIGDALAAGNDYDGAQAAYEKCLAALPDRLSVLKKIGELLRCRPR